MWSMAVSDSLMMRSAAPAVVWLRWLVAPSPFCCLDSSLQSMPVASGHGGAGGGSDGGDGSGGWDVCCSDVPPVIMVSCCALMTRLAVPAAVWPCRLVSPSPLCCLDSLLQSVTGALCHTGAGDGSGGGDCSGGWDACCSVVPPVTVLSCCAVLVRAVLGLGRHQAGLVLVGGWFLRLGCT